MSEQKYIRALFYITPKFKWKYIVNWLITIWTWCWFSHCELWTPSGSGRFKSHYLTDEQKPYGFQYFGTCYSSTMRGDDNGTRSADASLVLKHPKNWVYFEIPVTDEQYKRLIVQMDWDVKDNEGYSKWDILKFVSPIHFPDDERNICSEACNNWLVLIEILTGWGIVSPGKLYKKLIKAGYTVKPLKE